MLLLFAHDGQQTRGLGFIRVGAVGIRIRKMPAVFFRILGQEEKPSPCGEGAGGKPSSPGTRGELALACNVQILRLLGGAEDGKGVGYLQAVISEAETASGAPAFGAGRFTLTGGGELPAATEHPLQVGGGHLMS